LRGRARSEANGRFSYYSIGGDETLIFCERFHNDTKHDFMLVANQEVQMFKYCFPLFFSNL